MAYEALVPDGLREPQAAVVVSIAARLVVKAED
jgi:hypothetical protein